MTQLAHLDLQTAQWLVDRVQRLESQIILRRTPGWRRGPGLGGGSGGSSTANAVSYAVVTVAAGASTHSSTGITGGTVGQCVLLDEDGQKFTELPNNEPLEFKSRHRVGIPVDAIIALDAPGSIAPGTVWDGSGGGVENKVWAVFVDVYDYLAQLTGAADGTALGFDGGTAFANLVFGQAIKDIQLDAANFEFEYQVFGSDTWTVWHTGDDECAPA